MTDKSTGCFDMRDMMSWMMRGMMSGGCGADLGEMQDLMSKMGQDDPDQPEPQMAEMMLTMMMPQCIGMMLPAVDPDNRGEVAAAILSAILEKGSVGMSDDQMRSFLKALDEVLDRPT